MKNENKTKEQLISELIELRRRIVELEESLKFTNKQFRDFRKTAKETDKELERVSMELAISLFEVFEALKKISSGDPDVRIPEESEVELISKLKYMVNLTAKNIGEIVEQSHEFAMVLAEHFDVLHRVTKGELSARVSGESKVELLEALKKVANEMIESIDREITERKQVEEELAESEERYRRLFETSKDGLLLIDKQSGNVINVNPAIEELLGYSREEIIGKKLKDIDLFKDIQDVQGMIQKLDKAGFVYYDDVPLETKRGHSIDTEIYLVNRTRLMQFNIRDITERKRAEKALRQSEEKYRRLVDTMNEGLGVQDENGRVTYINDRFCELLGYSRDEIVGRTIYDFLDEAGREIVKDQIARRKNGEKGAYEIPWIKKDGQKLYTVVSPEPILDASGQYKGSFAVLTDITERKEAEETVLRLSRHNELILNSAGEGILGVDGDCKLTFVNPAAAEMLGYEIEELLGKHSHSTWHHTKPDGSPYPEQECPIHASLKDGIIYHVSDETFWRKDGTSFPVIYSSNPIIDNNKIIGAVVTFTDITERKGAEEEQERLKTQLLQAQKMEAVGQLAGGIAHDFNNILTAIIGYGHMLKMKMKEDDPLKIYPERILASSERAASLTQSLLAFSRKQIANPIPANLNEIIREVDKLFLRVIGEDIELHTVLVDKDVAIMADPGQIAQVLINLVTNARDAMPEGGLLTIETERVGLDDQFIKAHGYGKPGGYALLSIADTGIGMDKETTERIFEPFFTTKELGRGTGLGLAMVYGIIKQHKGYINVYSEPGEGTTFKIYLPLIKPGIEETRPEVTTSPERGTETILLAEDDEEVRLFTKEVLEDFGYRVIAAVDGKDAIEKFMVNKDKIHLLLFDVIMPKENGKEAYEKIRKAVPNVKVLFLSGYTADVIHKKGIIEKGFDFILKPISPTELLKKVREVLERQGLNDRMERG